MSASIEGPNPLRPYYMPPTVGTSSDHHNNVSPPRTTNSFGSSARNILADMDYSEYMSDASPSTAEMGKKLLEQALWKYTSVFLAQPFEVAKTVLQVQYSRNQLPARAVGAQSMRKYSGNYRDVDGIYGVSDDSDSDSQSYFTSSAPQSHTPSRSSRARRKHDSPGLHYERRSGAAPTEPYMLSHTLDLRSSSALTAVLSALWTKEGAWGLWKGTNSTYIYSILLTTVTAFTRSFLSTIFALPDPGLSLQLSMPLTYAGGLDILSSSAPFTSILVAVSAAGIAGCILAPLDIARTKIMLTPSTHPPRSILLTLKSLPSWLIPFSIAPVTLLHSTISTLLSASIPLFLRSRLGIDPLLTPNLYSIGTFIGQAAELGVKLPIETVLRRGQIDVVRASTGARDLHTVVNPGPYRGLLGTMYSIVKEEGERSSHTTKKPGRVSTAKATGRTAGNQFSKGQGLEGLWRGWRVGMWGLIGVWGAATVGGVGSKGGEF